MIFHCVSPPGRTGMIFFRPCPVPLRLIESIQWPQGPWKGPQRVAFAGCEGLRCSPWLSAIPLKLKPPETWDSTTLRLIRGRTRSASFRASTEARPDEAVLGSRPAMISRRFPSVTSVSPHATRTPLVPPGVDQPPVGFTFIADRSPFMAFSAYRRTERAFRVSVFL